MIQPEYVRIASSCDFGGVRRESGLPPPYYWTTSEKDHISGAIRTIEDTLHELDPELRRLSLDIHGERDRTRNRHALQAILSLTSRRGLFASRVSPFDWIRRQLTPARPTDTHMTA